MKNDNYREILTHWIKIAQWLAVITFIAFMIDCCDSKKSNQNEINWQDDDFDMQSIQRP